MGSHGEQIRMFYLLSAIRKHNRNILLHIEVKSYTTPPPPPWENLLRSKTSKIAPQNRYTGASHDVRERERGADVCSKNRTKKTFGACELKY